MTSSAPEICDPEDTMMFRVIRPAASLLIFLMSVFRGQSLTCHRTEYQIGNECCPTCPIGQRVQTDCEEMKSTSCRPCSDGTYMNKPSGFKSCFPCTECESAAGLRIKTSCTKRSDAVCEPLEGFYCTVSAEDGCAAAQKHTRCKPGQHISHNGTSQRDTQCSDCSPGTFSDGTFTSCRPHRRCESENLLLLTAGTDSADAQCGRGSQRLSVIVGAAVSVVVVVLFLLAAVGVFCHRRKIKRLQNSGREFPLTPEKIKLKDTRDRTKTDLSEEKQERLA